MRARGRASKSRWKDLPPALGATTHDGKEGPAAFREKRAAKFIGTLSSL